MSRPLRLLRSIAAATLHGTRRSPGWEIALIAEGEPNNMAPLPACWASAHFIESQ
jgi:hypothetical protein